MRPAVMRPCGLLLDTQSPIGNRPRMSRLSGDCLLCPSFLSRCGFPALALGDPVLPANVQFRESYFYYSDRRISAWATGSSCVDHLWS